MFGQWGSIGFLVAEEGGKGGHQGKAREGVQNDSQSTQEQLNQIFVEYFHNNHQPFGRLGADGVWAME